MKGLCLAGGGIKAAAHIGALKAFEEENIKFDCVSGASSGSIIATMYALGYSSDEMWKMFKRYCKNKICRVKPSIPISTAVRASCSFPVVFSPCRYNGIQLIDGGTRENLPWKELKEIGADEVFGISFNTIFKEKDCCKNIIDVAARAMELQDGKLTMYEKTGIDNLITIN